MDTVSTKPYLIRAIYEWCVDQNLTPYLAAQVDQYTRVPPGYAKDGQIVLNISPGATDKLHISNQEVSFVARFGGAVHNLLIPIANVSAIYARENGQGMGFELQDTVHSDEETQIESLEEPDPRPPTGRPKLKVVK